MQEYKRVLEVVGVNLWWTSSSFKSNSETYFTKNIATKVQFLGLDCKLYYSMDQVVKYILRYKDEKETSDETFS